MKRFAAPLALTLLGALLLAPNARAIQAIGPTSLQNGFPVWWVDDANFPVSFFPAGVLGAPVDPANPFSVQTGFGDESFWWTAGAVGGTLEAAGVLLEVAMEAAYDIPGDPVNGNQQPFARTRVRANVAAADGTLCAVTTPYEVLNLEVGAGVINFTDDVAGLPPDFAGVLAAPHTVFFSVAGAVVGAGGTLTGVGTIAAAPGANGAVLLPDNLIVGIDCPTAPNAFGPGVSEVTTDTWDVAALVFDTADNAAPVANPDAAVTGTARPVAVDVAANDADAVGAGNAHGLNLRSTAIVVPGATVAVLPQLQVGTLVVVMGPGEPVPTPHGSVMKNPDGTLTYTPAAGFVGTDTFQYVVQDTGGVVSGQTVGTLTFGTTVIPVGTGDPVPATVTVTVESLVVTEAVFLPKLMKWQVRGTSSAADGTVITVHSGATLAGAVIGQATVAGGAWSFVGKSATSPGGATTVSAASNTNPAAPVAALNVPLTVR